MSRELVTFEPSTFAELQSFAKTAANTDMVPKQFAGKPDAVLVAFIMGAELGLKPLQSLQNIAVINGRPGIWGDAMLALVVSHPECIDVRESFDADGTARCVVLRRGRDPVERTFSKADAEKAGLWDVREKVTRKASGGGTYQADNDSPWFKYPNRMLSMRARGFALRDAFPDALRGIRSAEELRDEPVEREVGGEVVTRPSTRAAAALNALAPQSLPEALHNAERVDVGTGEIIDSEPAAEPEPKPAITPPEELRACFGRIDAAMSIDAVNVELDFSRSFSSDAKREAAKRAAQRIRELKGPIN